MGLFVEAQIEGREVGAVIELPRAALRNGRQVLVVDEDDRIRIRDVEVLRSGRQETFVRAGVRDGERICLSPLETVVDGMKVRTLAVDAETPGQVPS